MSRKFLTSLSQKYYTDTKIYREDIQKVWKKSWLFAGFTCSIPKAGDFLRFNMDNESVIIVRDSDKNSGKINAFVNLCRHRGSRLIHTDFGNTEQFTCKYHGWTYDLDGHLRKANHMDQQNFDNSPNNSPNNFCKKDYSLYPIKVGVAAGLIFINFDQNQGVNLNHRSLIFDDAQRSIIDELKHHGLHEAKIAKYIDYDIKANWKIVYENNRECYHCSVAHPEYIQSNYDTNFIYQKILPEKSLKNIDLKNIALKNITLTNIALEDSAWTKEELQDFTDKIKNNDPSMQTVDIKDLRKLLKDKISENVDNYTRTIDETSFRKKEIESTIKEKIDKWKSYGLGCSPDSSFPGDGWYRASRMPLRKGWQVESLDGKPVSSLMGSFTDYDMGSCRIHTLPNFWIHASSDHAVSTQLWPVSPDLTKARVSWLVNSKAKEGIDYHLDKLLPFWKLTSEQDWKLCESVQLGVQSSYYQPGILSQSKEMGLERFIQWYERKIK